MHSYKRVALPIPAGPSLRCKAVKHDGGGDREQTFRPRQSGLNPPISGLTRLILLTSTSRYAGCRSQEVPVPEPWLSADEIAAHLGVTKDTIYTWIAEKDMPAHKVGRLWKFQSTEVDDWVRSEGAASENPTGD